MASILIAVMAIVFHGTTHASPVQHSDAARGSCQQFNLPITATAPGADYNVAKIENDIQATAWAIQYDRRTTPRGPSTVVANTTISGTFNIHAQLCMPESSSQSNILQLATHGLGFDARYWEPTLAGTSSYVDAALAAGYSILTYDRLGVGQSDKPDAYSTVQANLELEILHQITMLARNGNLSSYAHAEVPLFSRIVHVGHSFGSILTYAYISTHSALSDGAILTSFIPNQYLNDACVTSVDVSLATDRPNGYLTMTRGGFQEVFFGGNDSFTDEALYYGDSLKQPFPIGEWVSSYTLLLNQPDGKFEGPLQFVLSEFDSHVCKGDCKGVANETALNALFPHAKDLEVHIQPNTGHGLPFHKNATAGFEVMFDFLRGNGL